MFSNFCFVEAVFNTVIAPGWKGFLTLELVYHKKDLLYLPKQCPIAQIIFETVAEPVEYIGKYQNQDNKPVGAK